MPEACPSPAELNEFRAGSIGSEAFERIAQHLEAGCATCDALLLEFDKTTDGIAGAANLRAETFTLPKSVPASGTLIGGRYKLIEEIGEGGMGTVYMAQQMAPVRRAVAVKLIRTGMDSKAVLARFEAERQAL